MMHYKIDAATEIHYDPHMTKTTILQLRLTEEEKAAFVSAAQIAGLSLSSWARERLRRASIRELEDAGSDIPFLPKLPVRVRDDA
ncbi:MAG: hypothetical protein IT328_24015 [Caldilineaceae bacterium]|nr:hypothetical protein [Caldilineaceae bacterium]